MKISLAQVLFAKIAPDDINLVCQVITVGCHLRTELKLGSFLFLTRTRKHSQHRKKQYVNDLICESKYLGELS